MREILFRGKSEDNNEWVEGGFLTLNKAFYISYEIMEGLPKLKSICKETFGQFTGLTDKNGEKIFEGDIVRCYDENFDDEFTAVVEFGNPNCSYNWGFQLKPITETNFNKGILLWVEMEEAGAFIEVIGNITDNPELLKGGVE